MRLGKASALVLRFLCAAVVFMASNLIVLSGFFSVKHAAAATELSHVEFSDHIARTLPHPHDVGSSHSHEHGVPAPDGATPLGKSVPESLEGMAIVLLPLAFFRALLNVTSSSGETVAPQALAAADHHASICANDFVQALIFAPQAPPLTVS